MDSGDVIIRMNVDDDRLSSLPDDLIHKILSFIDTKHAIRTSVLSTRWRYIWASTPHLTFENKDFQTLDQFSSYVTGVLSGRNNQIEVSTVELTLRGQVQAFSKIILNKVLNYAFSHNVQQLNITCLHGSESHISRFSSQSLKHLTLYGFTYKSPITTPHTWDLLALTTLSLQCVVLYDDNIDESAGLFSNCANLKNLTLKYCKMMRPNGFNISHPGLSSLTLEDSHVAGDVVTPQLKNLTIRKCREMHLIFAPNLTSLQYEGYSSPLQVVADLPRLEKADICIYHPYGGKGNAHKVICLLEHLHSVKFLTLNMEIIKILCSYVELISHYPSPFANLKSLKMHPDYIILKEEETQAKVTMSTEVKNYLLDSSPGATVTLVPHEDIRAMMETKFAQSLIRDLREMLEYEKARIEAKMVKMHEQEKAHIDSCWKYFSAQIVDGEKTASDINLRLKEIKEILEELPASNRAFVQQSFSTLCAEADIVMNKVTDCMKMQCGENQKRLTG